MIEGGAATLNHWIKSQLWDEVRVFKSLTLLNGGISAPLLNSPSLGQEAVGPDFLEFYRNG